MKDNIRTPAISQRSIRYDECCAKLTLEKAFPNKYVCLEISDRPDLHTLDDKIGIEVTSSIPKHCREAIGLAIHLNRGNANNEEKAKCHIANLNTPNSGSINQCGLYKECANLIYSKQSRYKCHNYECECRKFCLYRYNYTETGLSHPIQLVCESCGSAQPDIKNTQCEEIINAINDKLKKLNEIYKIYPENNLYVYAETDIEDWMISPLAKWIHDVVTISDYEFIFKHIYLRTLNGLFDFDILNQRSDMVIPNSELCDIGREAKKIMPIVKMI